MNSYLYKENTGVSPYSLIQHLPPPLPGGGEVKFKKKLSVSFKTPAKRERAVTWWKPVAQTRPVLDSSSFAPVITLPRTTCSILLLAFSFFALVAALSQCLYSETPYLSTKLYRINVYYTNITLYSVRYYPRFHVTAVGFGTYYPWVLELTDALNIQHERQ
jgi:hypothetical protein